MKNMKTLKDLILKMCKLDYISIADIFFLNTVVMYLSVQLVNDILRNYFTKKNTEKIMYLMKMNIFVSSVSIRLLLKLLLIVCDNCEEFYLGDCPVHGPLLTLNHSSGHDEASLQYTSVFVPSELTVKPSKIANAGLGVFAKQFIPRGVRFGPYEGKRVLKEELTKDTSYMWEVL